MSLTTIVQGRGAALSICRCERSYIIGERINPTGKPRLARALAEKDWGYLQDEARRQVAAGADLIDVNVGAPGLDEVALLPEAVRAVADAVDVPIAVDTDKVKALAAALAVCPGKPLVNSVSGKAADLSEKLAVVAERGAAMVALCMDDAGIPGEPQARLAIARCICDAATARGIALEDIIVDPLVMSVATDDMAGLQVLETIRLVVGELGTNVTGGASNVSFGLPERHRVGAAFLPLAILAGLNCPITDPTNDALRFSIAAADLLLGRDGYARGYLGLFRQWSRQRAAVNSRKM
ncbi:MAG: dihydropteroate synthase [Chloroflexi bacterium]|nr:dihydropteroate synthase [Chloroflexota bacterium]